MRREKRTMDVARSNTAKSWPLSFVNSGEIARSGVTGTHEANQLLPGGAGLFRRNHPSPSGRSSACGVRSEGQEGKVKILDYTVAFGETHDNSSETGEGNHKPH
jgi:hypothetical protein